MHLYNGDMGPFQYKDHLGDFDYEDISVLRPCFSRIGNPFTGKKKFLLWEDSQGYMIRNEISVFKAWGLHIDGILPKWPYRHAYAWQVGPFWQDIVDI